MANKGKVLTAVAAVATSAALLLGGTFAWQSISQRALNEASDVINPGGRLHDDFNGENKDVYVENFAEEPIYARIRLGEYFEIIANYGKEGVESSTQVLGSKNDDDTYNYDPFYFDGNVDGDAVVTAGSGYWSWQTGGETVYMPTFNMNKDSLAADINGNYVDAIGGISNRDGNQYTDYYEYTDGETLAGTEIYDADSNDIEDDGTVEVAATHTAKPTGNATLISMAEWDGEAGPYWVYDTDGWVYWAQAIEPDTATGLLLDGIELNQVMDDTWYYAIEVVAQFVTADDVGKTDSTGFYADGNAPTTKAEELLAAIGVDMSSETVIPPQPESPLQLSIAADTDWYLPSSVESVITLTAAAVYNENPVEDLSGVVWSISGATQEGTALSADTGDSVTLTIAPYESETILVTADFTYTDAETGTSETATAYMDVLNGPRVATMWVYDDQRNEFLSVGTYPYGETNTLSFTTYFFPQYTGTIQPIEAAYSGAEAAALAEKFSYTLTNENDEEIAEMPGVSYTAEGATLNVTVDETVTDPIHFRLELEGSHITYFEIKPETVLLTKDATAADTQHITILGADLATYPLTLDLYESATESALLFTPFSTVTIYEDGNYDEMTEGSNVVSDLTRTGDTIEITSHFAPAGEEGSWLWARVRDDASNYRNDAKLYVEKESDEIAPTVEVVNPGTAPYFQTITISGLADSDYPLTVNTYEMETEAAYGESDPLQTMTISKTESGVTAEAELPFMSVAEENGVLTIEYNYVPSVEDDRYLGVTVTDNSGNVGSNSLMVQYVVGCFAAGTQVQTVDGLVNVEDIQPGDLVYSVDLSTGEKLLQPVTWVQEQVYANAVYTINAGSETITATGAHPFYVVGREWVAVEDLSAGDKLLDANGNEVVITGITYTKLDKPVQVYNFTVDDTHTYLITESGLLVHNKQ